MIQSKPKKRNTRSSGTLQEKAFFATALGLVFLILPLFFGSAPGVAQIRTGLLLPGVLALAIGVVLLAVHRARLRRASRGQTDNQTSVPQKP